ncbi:hypothetical protein K456DRAFT_487725 [Colletotrichum gloeosporioides 23]|nr:hypothetical protein K456DRAFT_487725 [Colletotrichum gloeosporioides 23]
MIISLPGTVPSPLPFAFSCAFLLSHRQSRVWQEKKKEKKKKKPGPSRPQEQNWICNTRTGSKIAVQAQHTDVSHVGGKKKAELRHGFVSWVQGHSLNSTAQDPWKSISPLKLPAAPCSQIISPPPTPASSRVRGLLRAL